MTTTASPLTAEEVGQRVLKLIDSIHTVDDISPAHIEKVMGVKVELNAQEPNKHGFGGKLTEAWSCGFGSLTDASARLMLCFDDQPHAHADLAPICKLDYDGYSKFLAGAGFKKSPHYADHGRILFFHFTRDDVLVDTSTTDDSKRTCVSMLTIEARSTEGVLP